MEATECAPVQAEATEATECAPVQAAEATQVAAFAAANVATVAELEVQEDAACPVLVSAAAVPLSGARQARQSRAGDRVVADAALAAVAPPVVDPGHCRSGGDVAAAMVRLLVGEVFPVADDGRHADCSQALCPSEAQTRNRCWENQDHGRSHADVVAVVTALPATRRGRA